MKPKQVAGRRVTDAATLDVMKMVVAGKLNVDLCAALVAAGARPVGLHGASAHGDRGRAPPADGLRRRRPRSGRPRPRRRRHRRQPRAARAAPGRGLRPGARVPRRRRRRAASTTSTPTRSANRVAVALDAQRLLLVSDVPGVLRDVNDPSSRIARLTVAEGRDAITAGIVTRGMIPKLEESFAAIDQGVGASTSSGKLGAGDLVREAEAPGSVGTVLVPS